MHKKLLIILALFSALLLHATTWHVSTTGADSRSGRNWRNAFGTLGHALSVAHGGDEIRLAAGCYEPPLSPGDIFPEASFLLKPGVALRGGFFGDETSPDERRRFDRDGNGLVEQWEFAGETILRLPSSTAGTILDGAEIAFQPTLIEGLTILHGNAFGTENSSTHPGMGGGAFLRGKYQIVSCEFLCNDAVNGGAIYADGAVQISECLFDLNSANGKGGAIFLNGEGAQIYNCVFLENGDEDATRNAGAIASADHTEAGIAFCTFVGNASHDTGSTLYLEGDVTLRSSVVWDAVGHPQSVLAHETCVVENCATTAGGFPGKFATGGILLASTNEGPNGVEANDNRPGEYYPCFVNPDSACFRLARGSALIKRGSSNGTIPPIDATGERREGTPSIGAYHSTLPRNAAITLALTAPLYVGTSQEVEIISDEPLEEMRLSLESTEILQLENQILSGIHAGTGCLRLDYTPEDADSASGSVSLELSVQPRPIRITANAQSWMPEIETFPELTWEMKAGTLLGNDRIDGELCTATDTRGVTGRYPILQGTLGVVPEEHSSDYQISFQPGILTIKEYVPKMVFDDNPVSLTADIIYGAPLDGESQLHGEFYDERTGQEIAGNLSWTQDNESLPSGEYDLEWIFVPEDERYGTTSGTIPVVIQKRTLYLTPKNLTSAYGDPIPEPTYTLENFAPGEDASALVNSPILAVHATRTSPVGEYPITVDVDDTPNYTIVPRDATLTITPREICIQVFDAEKEINTEDPVFTYQIFNGEFLNDDETTLVFYRDPGEELGFYGIDIKCPSPNYSLTTMTGLLNIHEPPKPQAIYLIVEDKEFQWGEEVPDFTCFFSFTPDGTQPVPEDLFPYFDFRYTADIPEANHATEISVEGTFNNRKYDLTVVPGELRCLPRLLTPVWPEIHKRFGEPTPEIVITARPEELPEGMESYSDSKCVIDCVPEERAFGGIVHGSAYPIAEIPGIRTLRILSTEAEDERFQWDTSVTGTITIGAETILVRKNADIEEIQGATTLEETLQNRAGETISHTFTYGRDLFASFQDALDNVFEGGTIWIDSYKNDEFHARETMLLFFPCTISNNYALNPDADVELKFNLTAQQNFPWLRMEGVYLRGEFRGCRDLTAEDCTLERIFCTECRNLILKNCTFVPRTYPTWSYADSFIELQFYNKAIGMNLVLDHVDFQSAILKDDLNINIYPSDFDLSYENMKDITNWPIDLTTCTFHGLDEDNPDTLKKHFSPYVNSTPNPFFLLP